MTKRPPLIYVNWVDDYETGIPELDRKHQALIAELNKLLSKSDVSVNSELVSDAMTQVLKLTTQHFDEEEEILRKLRHPSLPDHLTVHQEFREGLAEIILSAVYSDPEAPKKLIEAVSKLWQEHIECEIKELRAFAKAS